MPPEEELLQEEETIVEDFPVEEVLENTTAKERDEWKNKALLLAADMENLRKQTAKDVKNSHDFAISSFARNLLAVADNMERALEAINNTEETQENDSIKTLKEGVAMVANQLNTAFSKARIKKFESVGQPQDPEKHQVVAQVESDEPENTVVQEMQAGYMLNEHLLRPAMVTISKGE